MNENWLASFEALKKIYAEDAYSNISINEVLEQHKNCSGNFVRYMVKGTVRKTVLLDRYIEELAKNGLKGIKRRTLVILRMGIYAIEYIDSVPDHAAVNETVSIAKKKARGTEKFINAILRTFIREKDTIKKKVDPDGNIYLKYAFPKEPADLIISQYGYDEGEKIIASFDRIPDLYIRTNRLKTNRDTLMKCLRERGFNVEKAEETEYAVKVDGGNLIDTDLYKEGFFSIQSLPSMMAAEAFSPKEGSKVLDMCAAPGGKSASMAEIMKNSGKIISCDIHEHRTKLIKATAERLGIEIIKAYVMNAELLKSDYIDNFDFVLADVPCSGLGVIAGKPEIKIRTKISEYDNLVNIQSRILENAYNYTKPGGFFMYSTCTINKDENEGVTDSFIEKHPFIETVEKRTFLPYNKFVGFYYCIMRKPYKNKQVVNR